MRNDYVKATTAAPELTNRQKTSNFYLQDAFEAHFKPKA